MSLFHQIRRAYWRYVRRYHFEICQSCGRPVERSTGETYWLADDELWNDVEGGEGGIRCIPCFTTDAQNAGYFVHWKAVL